MKRLILFIVLCMLLCGCEVMISSVEVDASALSEQYLVGDFDWNDVALIVTKSGGQKERVKITAEMVSTADQLLLETPGTHRIAVRYRGFTAHFFVNIVDALRYKVNYVTGIGDEVITYTVKEGASLMTPPKPVRDGYVFVGWCLRLDDEELYDLSVPVTSDLTLYAKWDLVTLPAPSGLKVQENVLTWSAVKGAVAYAVYIDGDEAGIVAENSFDLSALEKGEYELQVKALANPDLNHDSPPSAPFLYNNYLKIYLSQPKNVRYGNHVLTWDAVPNATEYEIQVHGVFTARTAETSFRFDPPLVGNYYIELTSVGDGKDYLDSLPYFYHYILEAKAPENLTVEDGILVWDTVPEAAAYIIEINGVESETSEPFYDGPLSTSTPNLVRIKTDFGSGLQSEYTEYKEFSIWPTPVNVDYVYNEPYLTISWEGEAIEYEIIINGKKKKETILNMYKLLLNEINFGINEIVIKAQGDSTRHESRPSEAITIKKIKLPAPRPIIDGFNLTWEDIDGAAGYEMKLDGVERGLSFEALFECASLASGDHVFSVKAVAPEFSEKPEIFYYDSEAATYSFTKLKKPILELSEDLLFWSEIAGQSRYRLRVDDGDWIQLTDEEYRLPLVDVNMTVEVEAIGGENEMNSNVEQIYLNTLNNYYMVFTEQDGSLRVAEIKSGDKTKTKRIVFPGEYRGLPVTYIDSWAVKEFTELETVVFSESLEIIGTQAFMGCSSLAELVFPESLTIVGREAFLDCSSLTAVTFPENGNLEYIREKAFYDCENLSLVNFPGNLKMIEEKAFYNCALSVIEFPGTIESIDNQVFRECEGLKLLIFRSETVPELGVNIVPRHTILLVPADSLKSYNREFKGSNYLFPIGTELFYEDDFYCVIIDGEICILGYQGSEEDLAIPETIGNYPVTSIGNEAFFENQTIKTVTVPASVSVIGMSAFEKCVNLVNVQLNEGLKELGHSAFRNCTSLSEIYLPDSIEILGSSLFSGCVVLTSPRLPAGILEIPFGMFSDCAALPGVSIPETVNYIGYSAFMNCASISYIKLPAGVDRIQAGTFSGCVSLEKVEKDYDSYLRVSPSAFFNCRNLSEFSRIKFTGDIGSSAFSGCKRITTFDTEKITAIGKYAFKDCSSLTEIRIHPGISMVGDEAFYSCFALTIYLHIGAPRENYGVAWAGPAEIESYG